MHGEYDEQGKVVCDMYQGEIILASISDVSSHEDDKAPGACFTLTTPTRTYVLSAESPTSCETWMAELQQRAERARENLGTAEIVGDDKDAIHRLIFSTETIELLGLQTPEEAGDLVKEYGVDHTEVNEELGKFMVFFNDVPRMREAAVFVGECKQDARRRRAIDASLSHKGPCKVVSAVYIRCPSHVPKPLPHIPCSAAPPPHL